MFVESDQGRYIKFDGGALMIDKNWVMCRNKKGYYTGLIEKDDNPY